MSFAAWQCYLFHKRESAATGQWCCVLSPALIAASSPPTRVVRNARRRARQLPAWPLKLPALNGVPPERGWDALTGKSLDLIHAAGVAAAIYPAVLVIGRSGIVVRVHPALTCCQ